LKIRKLSLAVALAYTITPTAFAQISNDTVKIGFITDMSGVYADVDGPAGADAIKMAIADFGGTLNGKKIELVTADHQNKADIAASRARRVTSSSSGSFIYSSSASASRNRRWTCH
jgi:branched-chain amino acid transport system substrate-binding protein